MKFAARSLPSLLAEAMTCARDSRLTDDEIAAFAHSFADDCFSDLKDSIMTSLKSSGHIRKGPKCEAAAGDAANLVIAGVPEGEMILCACNHAWLHEVDGTTTTPDGIVHGYDDCRKVFRTYLD